MTRCEPPRRSSPRWMLLRSVLLSPASVKSLSVGLWRGPTTIHRPTSVTMAMMMTRRRRFFFITLLLHLLLPLHPCDGGAGDFEERLVAHDDERLLLDLLDGGEDAARRDDLVAGLERPDHVLKRLLPAPLRDDDEEVEDAEDEQERHDAAEEAAQPPALKNESEIGHRK